METKFQSSFIPKGPAASTPSSNPYVRTRPREKNLFSFIAVIIFVISFLSAVGTFGYKWFLNYRIGQMTQELDTSWATLEPETITELTKLDSRIVSSKSLIANHKIITPILDFLENSTPVTVRYTEFVYDVTSDGIEINMRGEARGYTALALQADLFSKSEYFRNVIFSDFLLNERGNVTFSLSATVDPRLVSYERKISNLNVPVSIPVGTSTEASSSTQITN